MAAAQVVQLPYELTLETDNYFRFKVYATNISGHGDVQCEVQIGKETLGQAHGEYFAGCEGDYRVDGTKTVTHFKSYEDVIPEGYQPPAIKLPTNLNGMLLFGQQNIEENSQNIFAVDARMDGTPLQLTEGMPGNIACPRLSPDKSTLVFFVSGAQSDLFLLNIQDGSLAKLTDDGTESVEASCADWSPDGSQLTYSATIKSENEQTIRQIFIINADGSKKQMLTANNDKKDGFRNPVWSPDSSMIAFNSDTNGIYTMNADGSNLKPFGNYGLRYGDFHWSPDGSQVVFACYASSAKTNICIANSDGKGFRKIETPSLTSIYETAWSPDGEWIAFIAKKKEVGNIFIIKPDGSNLTQVTRLEGITPLWLSWVSDFNLPATYVQVP